MKQNKIFQTLILLAVLQVINSCSGSKKAIGDIKSAREDKYDLFYQTWDGKIHEASSSSTSNFKFTPTGHDIMIDGQKIDFLTIRAYQTKNAYNVNIFGSDKKYLGLNIPVFAQRIIKGKASVFTNNILVDKETGWRVDYYFKVAEDSPVRPLRTYVLKYQLRNCKSCKSYIQEAESDYESLPNWRQRAADKYIGSEYKIVNNLVAAIGEYNSH